MKWTIEYDNDTDSNDECFVEWWDVTDGTHRYRASSQEDAEWLRVLLDDDAELRQALETATRRGVVERIEEAREVRNA